MYNEDNSKNIIKYRKELLRDRGFNLRDKGPTYFLEVCNQLGAYIGFYLGDVKLTVPNPERAKDFYDVGKILLDGIDSFEDRYFVNSEIDTIFLEQGSFGHDIGKKTYIKEIDDFCKYYNEGEDIDIYDTIIDFTVTTSKDYLNSKSRGSK